MCAVMVLGAAVPLAMADSHLVIKGVQGPRASAQTWGYETAVLGSWYGHIVNNGLRSLVVDVYDNTSGTPDQMSHQRIRFAAYGMYPTGTVDTWKVELAPNHMYEITVTPNGPKGANCTVVDMFDSAINPVARITLVAQNFLTVAVSGIDSTDDDGTIVSYEWDFGDGSAAVMGMDATHTYAMDGTYPITLLVTDNEGLSGSATLPVTVQHELLAPEARFTAAAVWLVVTVDASASTDNYGPIKAYDWDFGDGLTGTGVKTSHIYAVKGLYPITLTVTDSDDMKGFASKDVYVEPEPQNQKPIAMITATVTYLNVAVDSVGSYDPDPAGSIVSYAWLFGDGASEIGPTASHTYDSDGTYTITLTVKDDMDATGSATEMVTVQHELIPPVASFTEVTTFMVVNVDASASSDNYGPIASYDWNFGDDLTGTGVTASHIYAVEGTYTITLTVTDSDWQTGTASKDVKPTLPPVKQNPIAVFSWTAKYLVVSVDSAGSFDPDGTITSFAWTFGDGSTAVGPTATHTYATAGTKTITLTVTDNDLLTGSTSKDVPVVANQKPVAMFSWTAKYLVVSVDSAGSYDPDGTIASYAWDFGDGSSAVGPTATHTYATAGTKTITLTVTDMDGATGSTSKDVPVVANQKPVAVITEVVNYLKVDVSSAGSYDPDGTIASYAWDFGDGSTATEPTATHTYATPGTKTITLTATDLDGLSGTTSKPVPVSLPPPPVAAFTYTVTGMKVDVDASSSSGYGTLTYAWSWGDGTTGSGVTATHTYATSKALGAAVSAKARAPGPPHGIFGYEWLANGDPIPGCIVHVTNKRTGETLVYDSTREFWDPTSNVYSVDGSEFQLVIPPATQSWIFGDVLHVEATNGAYSGSAEAPITENPDQNDRIDVVLTSATIVKTITLIVTDSYGQSSVPVSRDVTLG